MNIKTFFFLFFIGCGSEFDTSEFVWEQKTDSTRINFDNYKNKDWIENKSKQLINKAKKIYNKKFSRDKENNNKIETQ